MPDETTRGAARCDQPSADATTPADLKVRLAEQQLEIDWKDGAHSVLSLAAIRNHCPCATCRAQREKPDNNPLQILKADPTDIRVTTAKLIGTYAIQFGWSDGHDTGIFDFRMLRALAGD